MKLNTLKLAPYFIAAGVVALVCAAELRRFDFFERLERITYDWRVRGSVRYSPTIATNLGFVSITDDSIKRVNDGSLGFHYGLYWPRHIYGRVARELSSQGAQAVAFDVLFAESRPDQGPVTVDGWPVPSDEYFAQAIGKAGNVVLAADQGIMPLPMFRTNALTLGDITAEKDSDGIERRARAFRIYTNWNRLFLKKAENPDLDINLTLARVEPGQIILPRLKLGDKITIPLDAQGRFDVFDVVGFIGDKIPKSMARYEQPYTEERIWHMGIVLAAQALKLDLKNAEVDLPHGRIILRGPGVERVIPVDKNGYFYIDWCLTANDPHLTQGAFDKLLEQDQARSSGQTNGLDNGFAGKLVVVGSTATGNDLTDRGATPLQKDTFLMSMHWNVANSIITGRFIRRSGLAVDLLLILAMGCAASLISLRLNTVLSMLSIIVVLLSYTLLAFVVFVLFRYWLPMVLPLGGALLATYVCLLVHLVVFEQAERRRVKTVFTKLVSPHVVNELLKTEKLPLDGTLRNMTVLFSDIRGFTEMTDVNREKAAEFVKQNKLVGEAGEAVFEQQARDTLATVNRYLSTIAECVMRHDGTIDKFIGDCVMAFWGAPVPNQQHAVSCVRAAIDLQQAVYRLNRERQAENLRREEENIKLTLTGQPLLPALALLAVGTGINTGVVTVGLMGSDDHGLNYTVFGREVNLASRLETVSGRGRIIISEATLAEILQDDATLALSCVELPAVNVKGIREAVHIYEVPWRTGEYAITGETSPPFKPSTEDTIQFTRATTKPVT